MYDRKKYDYERYHFWKDMGVCPLCKNAYPAKGRVHCPDCLDKMAVCRMNQRADPAKYKALREHEKEGRRKLREKRKAEGICTKCGKHKAREGRTTCKRCGEIAAEKSRQKYWKRKEQEHESEP